MMHMYYLSVLLPIEESLPFYISFFPEYSSMYLECLTGSILPNGMVCYTFGFLFVINEG